MKKDYCTQNDGDCSTCSLTSYGRDCMNEPILRPDLDAAGHEAEPHEQKGG